MITFHYLTNRTARKIRNLKLRLTIIIPEMIGPLYATGAQSAVAHILNDFLLAQQDEANILHLSASTQFSNVSFAKPRKNVQVLTMRVFY